MAGPDESDRAVAARAAALTRPGEAAAGAGAVEPGAALGAPPSQPAPPSRPEPAAPRSQPAPPPQRDATATPVPDGNGADAAGAPALDDGPFGPIAPPVTTAVEVPAADSFLVRVTVPAADGERIAREAILGGYFRPGDIEGARLAPILLAWIPVWRVDAMVEGFHVGLQHGSGPDGRLRWALPTGGYRHDGGVVLLPARRLLAVDPTPKLEIGLEEMIHRGTELALDGEVVAADVSRGDAEKEAIERLRHRVQPRSALYAKFDARVRSVALCWYPLWVARYRYRGEATRTQAPEECHVAVSARTGRIVSARHPSVWRSALGKVKGFFATALGS